MLLDLTAGQQLAAALLVISQLLVIAIAYRAGYRNALETQRTAGHEAACAELMPKLQAEQRKRADAEMLLEAARSQLRSRSDLQRITQIMHTQESHHA